MIDYLEAKELTLLENSPFIERVIYIDGYKISIFDYRLAENSDFNLHPHAKELRGLTFVFNSDGTLFKRYLLLRKFFNINQTEETSFDKLKDKKIKFINYKEDGSVVSFIKLPNGKVLAKTKKSFEVDQAVNATRIYNDSPDIKRFVDFTLDNDIVAIFEYVGPLNQIVLYYNEEAIVLLKLRDNVTGSYLDINDYKDRINGLKIANFEEVETLRSLMDKAEVDSDREGWVVEFDDNTMIKIKTKHYFTVHRINTEYIDRENLIISHILDDTIDDVLSAISIDHTELRRYIAEITSAIKKYLNDRERAILEAHTFFLTECGGDRKKWAMEYREHPFYHDVFKYHRYFMDKDLSEEEILKKYKEREIYDEMLTENTAYGIAKNHVQENTKDLMIAREFLKNRI